MESFLDLKLPFKINEIFSITFISLASFMSYVPIVASLFVGLSLVALNLAKAYKIYSETKRENKKHE